MNMPMVINGKPPDKRPPLVAAPGRKPDWTLGLRRIYDNVVHEPLPESVRALLARLDQGYD